MAGSNVPNLNAYTGWASPMNLISIALRSVGDGVSSVMTTLSRYPGTILVVSVAGSTLFWATGPEEPKKTKYLDPNKARVRVKMPKRYEMSADLKAEVERAKVLYANYKREEKEREERKERGEPEKEDDTHKYMIDPKLHDEMIAKLDAEWTKRWDPDQCEDEIEDLFMTEEELEGPDSDSDDESNFGAEASAPDPTWRSTFTFRKNKSSDGNQPTKGKPGSNKSSVAELEEDVQVNRMKLEHEKRRTSQLVKINREENMLLEQKNLNVREILRDMKLNDEELMTSMLEVEKLEDELEMRQTNVREMHDLTIIQKNIQEEKESLSSMQDIIKQRSVILEELQSFAGDEDLNTLLDSCNREASDSAGDTTEASINSSSSNQLHLKIEDRLLAERFRLKELELKLLKDFQEQDKMEADFSDQKHNLLVTNSELKEEVKDLSKEVSAYKLKNGILLVKTEKYEGPSNEFTQKFVNSVISAEETRLVSEEMIKEIANLGPGLDKKHLSNVTLSVLTAMFALVKGTTNFKNEKGKIVFHEEPEKSSTTVGGEMGNDSSGVTCKITGKDVKAMEASENNKNALETDVGTQNNSVSSKASRKPASTAEKMNKSNLDDSTVDTVSETTATSKLETNKDQNEVSKHAAVSKSSKAGEDAEGKVPDGPDENPDASPKDTTESTNSEPSDSKLDIKAKSVESSSSLTSQNKLLEALEKSSGDAPAVPKSIEKAPAVPKSTEYVELETGERMYMNDSAIAHGSAADNSEDDVEENNLTNGHGIDADEPVQEDKLDDSAIDVADVLNDSSKKGNKRKVLEGSATTESKKKTQKKYFGKENASPKQKSDE